MKAHKAQEILKGNVNHEVTYKDKLVWLEHIDVENQKALVSVIATGEKMQVPVNELNSQGLELK
ncbi:H-type small acid-soluble spore protein [Tissierella sp. MB52-C2]|jgi:H-type small acid-soluble spore protein|uniref:Small, acid-soluble spore protein, H family n=1 Tax=Tissierella pigra TaxID=2607614 RepID=A0A6N7XV43_9FIRM|nr:MULTISPECIES: H-type small acid-soluble spore protein [Tissierella]MSU00404.1 small, acid-soluble spore protein, H family [Tissierella pigra]WMM23990.1 H-type small acid-soluble spore protein [Tissierella sp. MB52-C2]